MPERVRRGYVPSDAREFGEKELPRLREAQRDVVYLLNRDYGAQRSVTFVGDRFQLSSRQRMALTRASCRDADARGRREKETKGSLAGKTLFVDGFNVIIPLEIALSGSTLLLCMDGAVRDLAGLHGTYRLIDRTDEAVRLIGGYLEAQGAAGAEFYLDSPVSNAGRLKTRILELLGGRGFGLSVSLVKNADLCLWGKENAATGDGVILDHCKSWVNLVPRILRESLPDFGLVDLSDPGRK